MFKERVNNLPVELKGVVLGGGRGTRLYPLTAETNKHLLPIGEKTMVVRAIDQLLDAGVRDIVLLIDEKFASQFMGTLKDGSDLGIRSLAYVWQHPEGKGLPTAIAQIQHLVKDEKIVVACGDVLIENGIKKQINEFLKQDKGACLISAYVEDTAGYSPLEVTKEKVLKIIPKDKNRHEPGLIDLGIYMYHSDVFEKIRELAPSARGETEIWDLNQIYASRGELNYAVIDGWWCDTGESIKKYSEANRRYGNK